MIKRFLIFMLPVLAFSFSSCDRKELKPDVMGNPVFYLRGELDGSPFNFNVGVDSLYANTFTSVYPNSNRLLAYIFSINLDPDLEYDINVLVQLTLFNDTVPYRSASGDKNKAIVKGNYYYLPSKIDKLENYTSHINLEMVNVAGPRVFTTSVINQQADSYFRIIDVSEVENTDGKKFRKAEIEFQCWLGYKENNIISDTLKITNGRGVIAF